MVIWNFLLYLPKSLISIHRFGVIPDKISPFLWEHVQATFPLHPNKFQISESCAKLRVQAKETFIQVTETHSCASWQVKTNFCLFLIENMHWKIKTRSFKSFPLTVTMFPTSDASNEFAQENAYICLKSCIW